MFAMSIDSKPSLTGMDAHADRPPRAAATVVVVRDGPDGIEVLLLRRAERGDHNSGAWVFPGGTVDARDREAHALCGGLDDAEASRRLGVSENGLDYYIAALRECFEESGLLYASDARGDAVSAIGDMTRTLAPWRGFLHHGERSLAEMCQVFEWRLAPDRLVYLSHWLTPLGRLKRFDTRFFVAQAPLAQTSAHDELELVEHLWLKPADALARGDALKLMNPTRVTLETIARFDGVRALLEWARAPRRIPLIQPRVATGREGPRPVMPLEPAWAEIGRLDPQGHGHASYDLVPGMPVRLSKRVIRITANNGSVMTGPGTNTYLIGSDAADEWAVIDPGPASDEHVERLLAAVPGSVRWIFVTHTHTDHSPAALLLKARTGASVHGRCAAYPQSQDPNFLPDVLLTGGERIALPGGVHLRVIHTPGHASNHLCYLLEEENTLFTGDHVMQGSTVVISPPDGDMAAYIASLRELLDMPLEWIAPGHGFLIAEPRGAMQGIIEHRLRRETKVVDAIRALEPASPEAMLLQVYDDIDPRMHGVAMRSLKAHLGKLIADGVAVERDGHWMLIVP